MIRRTINPGTMVFHEMFGFGVFKQFESKIGAYCGFALVKFNDYPGISVIHPKKLTEIEDAQTHPNPE
jgi:hypothetical protein